MRRMENPFLSVIRVWAAMAWADGKIAKEEAAAMKRLIDGSGLKGAELETALGFLERRVELDTVGLEALSTEARHGIYRAAAKMAYLDKEVAASEVALLERIREGLGIDVATATQIEASLK